MDAWTSPASWPLKAVAPFLVKVDWQPASSHHSFRHTNEVGASTSSQLSPVGKVTVELLLLVELLLSDSLAAMGGLLLLSDSLAAMGGLLLLLSDSLTATAANAWPEQANKAIAAKILPTIVLF